MSSIQNRMSTLSSQKAIALSLSKGFTLLELLVVISVIGILVALSAVSYTTIQKKGRDSRRKSDMKAVQNAFEQYYAENNNQYEDDCNTMAIDPYLPGGLPQDPKPNNPEPYNFVCQTDAYCLCALLETTVGNADDNACSYDSSGDESYFCTNSLQ